MDWFGATTAMAQLALGLVVLASAPRSALALSLGLLCLDVAGWNAASLAHDLAPHARFHFVDHALSSMTAPLALDFVLAFAGRRRAARVPRAIAYLACGALAAVSALAAITDAPAARAVAESSWSAWLLATSIPTMLYALVVLGAHLRAAADPLERARARLVLTAFAVATLLGATEVMSYFDPLNLALGSAGMLFAGIAMAIVTLRLRLFDRDVSLRLVGLALAIAAVVVVADAIAFRLTRGAAVVVALATAALAIALVAGREWARGHVAARERRAELLALGRFAAQMAHDAKNPLAALRGAAQVLRHDLTASAPSIDRLEFVDLMSEQVARLERIVDTYGRLARLDLARDRVSMNDVIRGVLRRQSPAGGVRVEEDLDGALPACDADRDMMATVVENLVRNAVEAMPAGGVLRVRTFRPSEAGEPIALCVEDTGVGMDARTREQAFDDFFTTKAAGTGLGLAFVQRIVQAHGGRVFLASQVGRGTTVQVVLPRA